MIKPQSLIRALLLALPLSLANAADDNSPVLIEQDGVTLTLSQFEQALARLPNAERADVTRNADNLMAFVVNLFAEQGLIHEAEQQNIHQAPRIAARIEQARGVILREAMLERHRAQLQTPDFEALAEERYRADPQQYARPERIRIAQLYLAAGEGDREQVRARIRELLAELQAGADFAELARAHSQGPNAAAGGELQQWLVAGRDSNPVLDAAFALENVGDLSEVIEGAGGFRILKLLERREGGPQPFERVKDRIVTDLARGYYEQAQLDYIRSFYPQEGALFNREVLNSLLAQ